MKWTAKRIGATNGCVLFALGTVWIHHEVKAKMEPAAAVLEAGSSATGTGSFDLGDPLSDFTSIDLQGETVTLSEFRGREVVMLDFWATWCAPRIDGMPDLQELHEEYDGLERHWPPRRGRRNGSWHAWRGISRECTVSLRPHGAEGSKNAGKPCANDRDRGKNWQKSESSAKIASRSSKCTQCTPTHWNSELEQPQFTTDSNENRSPELKMKTFTT